MEYEEEREVSEEEAVFWQIEEAVKRNWQPGKEVTVHLFYWPSEEAQTSIIQKLKKVGWTVVFQKTEWPGFVSYRPRRRREGGVVKIS